MRLFNNSEQDRQYENESRYDSKLVNGLVGTAPFGVYFPAAAETGAK